MQFEDVPLCLAEEVEQLTGANGEPMLYHRKLGNYIRLSPMGADLLRKLDGTLSLGVIRAYLLERFPGRTDLPQFVDKFFTDLRQAGFLTVEPAPERPLRSAMRYLQRNPVLRLPLFKSVDRVAAQLAEWIRGVAGPRTAYAAVAALAVAVMLCIWHLVQFGVVVANSQLLWAVIAVFYLQHVVTHELTHGVTCRWFGVPVREAGVGLMLYIMPIAYVDRTDAYRLESRWSRAMIALVGPLHDLTMAAVWASIHLVATAPAMRATAHALFVFAFLMMLGNLNLLFPTDGYHAMEAALGEINLRRRAVGYLWALMRGKPAPYGLGTRPWRTRIWYPLYGLAAVAGFVAFGATMAKAIVTAILHAKGSG